MICFRCRKEIEPKEDYYSFTEYASGKKIRTDYAHKKCWDDFMNSLNSATSSLQKSNYLLNAMGTQMKKMGMIPDEEVIIK